jgi:hypothetical protein
MAIECRDSGLDDAETMKQYRMAADREIASPIFKISLDYQS